MPVISQHSAAQFTLEQLVDIFADGFSGYIVPIAQPLPALAARIRCEQIDLYLSRVVLVDDAPAGLCLLAQRGTRVRVAAMGIAPAWRGKAVGRALLDASVEAARSAGARRMLLEVFTANRPAVALYESAGFAVERRLLGFERAPIEASAAADHRVTDVEELAGALAAEPDRAWPWQLAPHTLVSAGAPAEIHALGREAYACMNRSNPEVLALRTVYVVPSARRRGLARRLLASVQSLQPQAGWVVPPVVPEEFDVAALAALGFGTAELHQFEMTRALTD